MAHFTGRAQELAALTGLLDRLGQEGAGTVVISAIGGTAGVGKTALAVQWAHQAAGRFPGGQLYANLRGYDPDRPVPPADVLAGFLRSLGVSGPEIPPGEEERTARYRSLLAGRKALIVLDNAGSAEQVRPLLPGSSSCVVVVTSRDALAGLAARDGATRLELDLLPMPDSVGLLRTLIGSRADDDPGAAATLAELCCRLPLALRVAAELAASRRGVPLARLVAELADQRKRLDLLDADGDPRTAVRAVFSWSCRHLDADATRAFRLVGLHPGPDFDPYAVAVVAGVSVEQARAVLEVLSRAHLIQPASPGRYGMHDLLRAYARDLTARHGGEQDQDAALTRLYDHYLHTAAVAMDTLYPAESDLRPRIPPVATPVPPVTRPAAARAWLDAERAALVAVTVHAAENGRPSHAIRLSGVLFRHLYVGGHYPEALTVTSHARAAVQRTGDRRGEALALNHLAAVHYRQGRNEQAADDLRQALALYEQIGYRGGHAGTLGNLCTIYYQQGRYREAISLLRQAPVMDREARDRLSTAIRLDSLGNCEERLGRYDLAARHHRQAMAIAAGIGAQEVECNAMVSLGTVGLRQGRYRQSAELLDRALALASETGNRDAEAEALARTGDLRARQGYPEEAVRHLRQALALYRELGNPAGEADALNSLGAVLVVVGQGDQARAGHTAALALATRTGDRYQQARAHYGLGQACHADGEPDQARSHWQRALALFAELGTPETGQVRALLAAAHNGSDRKQDSFPGERTRAQ